MQEYIESIGESETARVTRVLGLLAAYGLGLGVPYVRSLRGKLWELRIKGQSPHRVLYFAASGQQMVLLHTYTKRTRKTPAAEIDTVLRRMFDYRERTK